MNLQVTNSTEFLWNTPFGLDISISGYSTQTTRIQYFDGTSWITLAGTESSGPTFQDVIDAPSKMLRLQVDNPSGPLQVSMARKRIKISGSSGSSDLQTQDYAIAANAVTVTIPTIAANVVSTTVIGPAGVSHGSINPSGSGSIVEIKSPPSVSGTHVLRVTTKS